MCVSEASSGYFPSLGYARDLAPPINRPHKAGHKNDMNNIKYNQYARTTGYTRKSRGQTRTYVRLVAECSPLRFERCHECQWTVYYHKNLHVDDYALSFIKICLSLAELYIQRVDMCIVDMTIHESVTGICFIKAAGFVGTQDPT